MTFLRYFNILLIDLFLIALPIGAQTVSPAETDSLTLVSDTLVADSASLYPEWHVKPEIPKALRAPKHAPAAAGCPLDSILTFNIDSVLVEVTLYGYDAAGHTINQEVWTVKADGTRVGKEKNEYAYTGSKQTMTAVYEWDVTTNNWKGTEKFVYTYSGNKMTSNTSYVWLNAAWVADVKLTYSYDAAGRDATYFEYHRNTTTNQLEYFKGFEYVWIDATRKSLEIQYTAAVNNVWTAGTKEEWAYDADDNMTLHADYTISTGNWIGSSKEEWAYTDNVLTMHAQYSWGTGDWVGTLKETWVYGGPAGQLTKYEKFGWYNNDWSMTLREIAAFDEAGHQTLIENYTGANGVPSGVIKEEYTFDGNIQTMTVKYTWSNGDWVGSEKETWTYGGPAGQLTLHEKFAWANNDWSKTLKEETEYSGANIVRIENYTYANGVPTGTNKETWTYGGPSGQLTLHEQFGWANNDWSETLKEETEYSGANIVRIENYTYANGVPTGTNKETWTYGGPSGKQTKHEKSEWGGSDWTVVLQENTIYNGNTTTIENYERLAGVWTGTKKEEKTVTNGKPTLTIIYAWANGDWVNSTKEIWAYNSAKKETLHEKYEWENSDWKLTVQENTTYDGNNIASVENYELQAGVWTGTKKEEYTYLGSTTTKTQVLIYQWINNDWMYQSKENWTYTSGKVTLHDKAGWNGEEWITTMREIADFDAAGNQILVENYARLVTTGWTGLKKEEYTFEGGTKTSTVIYAWTNDDWVKSTKNEIGYQDGNTQVSDANYTWGGDAWVGSGNRTYTTKDSENRVTELLTKDWPSGATEWTNSSLTTHKFDEEGDDILTYNGTWNGSRWAVSSMTRLDKIFDEKGRQLLKASWKCSADSNWIGVEKDTAKYSATDKLLYTAKYKGWKNNDWVPVSKAENTYNSDDKPILEESYTWSSTKWRGVYRYEYEYDAQGRQTSYTTYKGWNTSTDSWKGSTKQDYVYYKNYKDKYESQTTYSWKNNAWSPTFSYLYTYDSSDREIEQIVRSYSSNTWKNKNKYVKKYDGSTLVGEYEYAWSNNDWALRSQHEWYYEADAQAKLRREILGKWTSSGLTSYEDKHYSYGCDARIIRFVNYNGTVLQSNALGKGAIPVYSGETPVREADAQYTYTYTGWDKPIVSVTADATYTATYSHTVNSYTITWLNDNDSQIDQTTVEYGVVPAHANPAKQATAEFTYTFTGWTPEVVSVTGDATYKATFSATKNSYTITWLDEKGSLLDQTTVEYGVVPTHDDVTKASTDQYTYTFAGWTPDTVAVTGDATYQATFTATTKSYTITWLDENGIEIDKTEVAYGVVPTHEDPTKDNTAEWTYTFTGWTPDTVAVTGDATYKATFSATKNSYTITWLDENGSEIDKTTVEYGVVPTHDDIAKAATDQYTYTFAGWTPDTVAVTGDATYTATFTATTNTYTITWLDENGIEINTTEVEYGVVPTHDDPTKAATDEYIYIFAGWTPDTVAVTGDATYQATYTQSKKSYIITWLDENGIEIDKTKVAYGVVPTHEDPIKDNTAEWTYTFTGWTPDTVAVTGDATYKATFSAIKNSYTITWLNDDNSLIDETHVEYGVVPTHDDAVKAATDEYTYTFKGWNPAVVAVTGVATYTAQFDSVKNSYTITWLNDDNSLIDESDVAYGVVPTHDDAVKAATDEYTYTFKGWDPAVAAVTGVATYTAQFDSIKNSYTITWLNDDHSLIDETHVEYGVVPTHDDVVKAATDEYTYTFKGWDPAVVAVTGVATYTAQFDSIKNSYTITWLNDDGSQIDQTTVEYGLTPAHAYINKENTAEWTYTFVGWTPEIKEVTGDATYTATFDSVKNSYAVTFYDEDGTTVLDSRDWEYGAIPTCAEPTKPATKQYIYTFSGWTPEIVAVTGEAAYTATYATEEIKYHVSVTTDDAVHGKAGFVYADSGSSTLLTEGDILNGTWIELQATADNEWHFDHWSDGDTSAVRQVEVTSDMQFTAYFAINCGDYPSLPVVCLYDWLLILDARSIHEMGYTFGEEDVTWYRVHGEPDKLSDGASADDELLGTGYSFTLNQSLVNTGDYYAMVDVSKSSSDMLCTDMMRSKIVHFASSGAAAPPMLEPALVRPNAPQRVHHLNPEAPTVISIYDIAGHLLRTISEEGVEQINLQAEGVAGCYQIVVQNGDLRTVLRYIVVN